MDSLDLIQTFREVAQRGSFSAAARALDLSPASVTRYVALLEERFGVRLFHRTTRKVSLTDAGQLLFERSGPVLELVQLTQDELQQRAHKPSGRLTVTAPHGLMHSPVAVALGRFLVRYPEVSLNLQLTNRVIDLAEEGVDMALRVGPIPDANMIVRRLMRIELAVAATPAYWRAHGRPAHPRELGGHRTLSASPNHEAPYWRFVDGRERIELALQPHVLATDGAPLLTLALMDLGVIYLPRLALQEHLSGGALEPVLQPFMPRDIWLFAAYAQRRHNSAALTALLDFLAQQMPQLMEPAEIARLGRS